MLRHAGVDGAEVIVSTRARRAAARERRTSSSSASCASSHREAIIIANCTRVSQVASIRAAGADHVFRIPSEVALGILPAIYAALNAGLPSYLEALEEEHGKLERRMEVID